MVFKQAFESLHERLREFVLNAILNNLKCVTPSHLLPSKEWYQHLPEWIQQEQEALAYQFRLEKEKSEAERKRIAAEGEAKANRIINNSLTPNLLKMRGIEATSKLAESPNSKVIVVGSGKDGLPIILGNN